MTQRCPSISPDRREQCVKLFDVHHTHVGGRCGKWLAEGSGPLPFTAPPIPFPYVRIAFSGARKFRGDHETLAIRVVDKLLHHQTQFGLLYIVAITGAAIGFDAFIAKHLYLNTHERVWVHTVIPSLDSYLDPNWYNYCHSFEKMPDGTTFPQRNARMVELVDWVYGFPSHSLAEMGAHTGGTWNTIQLAQARHKTDHNSIYVLDPVTKLSG